MSLRPADVRAAEFSLARRGYDETQVDDFLDKVVAALEERDAELAAARQKLELADEAASTRGTAVQDAPTPREEPQAAVDLLALAHRTAQDHVAAAEASAAEMLTAARREATRTTTTAEQDAVRLRAEAEAQHREALEALHSERRQLEQTLSGLHAAVERSREQLEAYLTGVLATVREPVEHQAAGPRAVPALSA